MTSKYTFQLKSEERRRALPHKIIIGQGLNESVRHVALKLLGWLIFYRERLQIETDIQNDAIPFVPDLAELGYDMRPLLWIECGECTLTKLHKLAVKCPEAELWILKRSPADARHLVEQMEREDFRRGRYGVIGFDPEMFGEVCNLLKDRNELHWFSGEFDPARLQFDLNGLWFDSGFTLLRY